LKSKTKEVGEKRKESRRGKCNEEEVKRRLRKD
jgi:hypothetical protein